VFDRSLSEWLFAEGGRQYRFAYRDKEKWELTSGTIKKLVRDRGFGFIEETSGQDIFFHASGVQDIPFDDLQEGETVEYEEGGDTKGRGRRAINVRLVVAAPVAEASGVQE
jgi:cold shock protein